MFYELIDTSYSFLFFCWNFCLTEGKVQIKEANSKIFTYFEWKKENSKNTLKYICQLICLIFVQLHLN